MTDITPERATELLANATPGPWQMGNSFRLAGVLPKRFGEGKCAYCGVDEPVWTGRADINGTRMDAHKHRDTSPYEPEHHIYGPNDALVCGNYDYEEGGVVDPADARLIAAAPDLARAYLDVVVERDALREQLAQAQAKAWDEGWDAGCSDIHDGANPYRAGLGDHPEPEGYCVCDTFDNAAPDCGIKAHRDYARLRRGEGT